MPRWNSSVRLAFSLAGAASFALTASASCKHPKCSLDVDAATTSTVPVIIQYANDPSDAEVSFLNGIGPVRKHLHAIGAVAATVPASQLTTIANRPGVAYISLDRKVKAHQQGGPANVNPAAGFASAFFGPNVQSSPQGNGFAPGAASAPNGPALPGQPAGTSTASAPTTPATGTTSSTATSLAPIGTTPEYTAEPINAPWAIAKGFNGQGIGVAVIDSGINPVDDLQSSRPGSYRVVYSQNFVPNETATTDSYGHGTHVAGLIAGNGTDSNGRQYSRTFLGIAPEANLINLRVLDENGEGSDSAVIAAIERAIALKSTYNVKVINLSLGRPIWESYAQDPLCQAVEQAWKAGIVVVAAAGNDGRDLALNTEGYGTIEAPGNDPYIITVGAANTMNTAGLADDVMASYSSKGPTFIDQVSKPDLIAPGNLVTSLLSPGSNLQVENPAFYTPQNWYTANGTAAASTTYFPLSGTSMAAAVASGAIADIEEVAGYLTPDQIKVLLMLSANKNVIPQTNIVLDPSTGNSYTAHSDVFTQGAGYLDLQATITNVWNYGWAIPASGYALSPTASYDPVSGNVTLVAGSTTIWGRSLAGGAGTILNAGVIYGQNAFNTAGASAVWGSTALWGRDDPAAFTALWGSTALWGRGTADAATALWGAAVTTASGVTSGTSAMWGYSTTDGTTALWGRAAMLTQ